MKKVLKIAGQVLLLTAAGFIADAGANLLLPPLELSGAQENQVSNYTMLMLLLMRFFWAIAIFYAIRASTLGGLRLVLYLFIALFGLSSIMTQIETIVFLKSFPALSLAMVGQFVLAGFISAVIFTPVAVFVAGRKKTAGAILIFPKNLPVKILLLSLIYPAIYLFFGYFVAYRFDAVTEFYKNDPMVYSMPLLIFIQFIRGGLWVIFILPLMATIPEGKKQWIASTLLYSLLVGTQLMIPNPVMPDMVRLGHFLEVTSSMAVYGFLIAWVLYSWQIPEKKYAAKTTV